ncbi:Dienelactone hydrolase [Noviherbaspirillum humi]|uniref:Dienelactone hydrolase n=1 Tax=Noviherbaspirillum humi TaxID=1688639 RepID=A0A239KJI0_9BURK|nr:dienelactone hydrolase family protein [Noviherbaspirillum humi]SNT18536.1 Dienelactone hydrolase [Noviherbaspirillum humi]
MNLQKTLAASLLAIAAAAWADAPFPGAEKVMVPHAADGASPPAITGWWISAGDGQQPKPAVLALHGCGGIYSARGDRQVFSARHADITRQLHRAGYHVLWVDSFSDRGKTQICTEKIGARGITARVRAGDVRAAMRWLGGRSEVDVGRIVWLGWSHGGSTVLQALDARDEHWRELDPKPRAAAAYYPGCKAYDKPGYAVAVPTLVMIGEKDDWTPAPPCVSMAQRLSAAGAHLTLELYDDSYHGFDAPGPGRLQVRSDVPNGAMPGQGVTSGPNPAAREASRKTLLEFLERALD